MWQLYIGNDKMVTIRTKITISHNHQFFINSLRFMLEPLLYVMLRFTRKVRTRVSVGFACFVLIYINQRGWIKDGNSPFLDHNIKAHLLPSIFSKIIEFTTGKINHRAIAEPISTEFFMSAFIITLY